MSTAMVDTTGTQLRRRKAWGAALLSLLLPGLGQVYNRQVGWALVLLATLFALWPAQFAIAQLPPSTGVVVYVGVLAVGFGARLVAIVQAATAARRIGTTQLGWYNRWYVYVGLMLAAVVWQVTLPLIPIPTIEALSIPSSSMVPSLLVGDYIEARTRTFEAEPPRRGEIAVYLTPMDETNAFVSRIIGLPGDRVQMRDGRLYLNGAAVERKQVEDYVDPSDPTAPPVPQYQEILDGVTYRVIERQGDLGEFDNTEPFDVPDGHVFVVSDNRDNANDSRVNIGFIPVALLQDRPLFIYWSRDWSRIGLAIE